MNEMTEEQVEAAISRYRQLAAGGVAHWEACKRAASAFGLRVDLVHHRVQRAEGRVTA